MSYGTRQYTLNNKKLKNDSSLHKVFRVHSISREEPYLKKCDVDMQVLVSTTTTQTRDIGAALP